MRCNIKASYMVTPSRKTWTGRLPLSELDQTCSITHQPVIYFYQRPPPNWLTPSDTIVKTLISSLSKALTPFYPFAGRLIRTDNRGRFELDCSAMGVPLLEAEIDSDIDFFVKDFSNSSKFHNYLIPCVDYAKTPIEDQPLFLLQVTRFRCGGLSLGLNASNAVSDGQATHYFFNEFARLARAEPLKIAPLIGREALRAGGEPFYSNQIVEQLKGFMNPPTLIGSDNSILSEPQKETVFDIFKLTKNQVERLKNKANNRQNKNGRKYSSYEAVAGHIWRCACKARGHRNEQSTLLSLCVDVRRRLRPPLPPNYLGNAVMDVVALDISGNLVTNPLSYASERIREAIEDVTTDFVHSAVDFLKRQPVLFPFQDLHSPKFYGNPNLEVISWLTLPLYGVDFGWGGEICVLPAAHGCSDGAFFVIPSPIQEREKVSIIIAGCFQAARMDAFVNFFYEEDTTSVRCSL